MKLYYLASPYSHPDPAVMEARFEESEVIHARLTELGYDILAPLALCNNISKINNLPKDYAYWKRRDRLFVSRCDVIIVCMMDGWKESIGVQDELAYAKELGKEVLYVDESHDIIKDTRGLDK